MLVLRTADTRKESEALGLGFVRAFRLGDPVAVAAHYSGSEHVVSGETLVAEERGVLAAQATAAKMCMTLAGVDVSCPGVTLVACAPEHRRKGAVDRLMRALLTRMRKRGEAVSALYPYNEAYYAKFGYARVDWPELYSVSPTAFRDAPERLRVRRLDPAKDRAALVACYDRWRAGRTGPVVRGDHWWRTRVLGKVQDGVVYEAHGRGKRGQIEGYLLYQASGAPNLIASDFAVKELVTSSPEARRGLYGFLASLGNQYQRVHVLFPRGEGRLALLGKDAATELALCARHHQLGSLMGGAMLRIVDLRRALAVHPGPARSGVVTTVGLDLTDPVFRDQSASFDVSLGPTGARATKGAKSNERLAMSVNAFSQVFLAAARATTLLEHGAVTGHPEAAAALDAAFAGPVPFWSELNGF